MSSSNDWNAGVIEEFRANGGKVGGQFDSAPLLLLTTIGARSGRPFTTPMMYLPDGDRMIVFASKAGAPTNPDWYHNLVANPRVEVEVGDTSLEADAVVVESPERDDLYARQSQLYPAFADYQAKTSRQIPVVALTPVKP